jgi:4-amino-4-deoxy-L-arabinose transferase-like glycosyltransferase
MNLKPQIAYSIMIFSFLIFVLFKWDDLFIPFFWDEAGSYVKGVLYMLDNGVYFHPKAIDPFISFGHPLLLHFILASLAKLFGYSIPLFRATMLLISLATIGSTFRLALKLSNSNYLLAVLASLLLIIQPIFYAQSTLVLLEMLLTCFSLWAIVFYVNRKYLMSALFACGAVLVKETGIVLAIALLLDFAFKAIIIKSDSHSKKLPLFYFLFPFIVVVTYYSQQFKAFGWFLNPYNLDSVNLSFSKVLDNLYFYFFKITFIQQGRFALSLLALSILVHGLLSKEIRRKLKVFVIENSIIFIFTLGFILFSSLVHNLERYYVVLIPFYVVLISLAFKLSRNKYLPIFALGISIIVGQFSMKNNHDYSEINMNYKDHVESTQNLLSALNNGEFKEDSIFFYFPLNQLIKDYRMGYISQTNYIICNNIENAHFIALSKPGGIELSYFDTMNYKTKIEFTSNASKALLIEKRK